MLLYATLGWALYSLALDSAISIFPRPDLISETQKHNSLEQETKNRDLRRLIALKRAFIDGSDSSELGM